MLATILVLCLLPLQKAVTLLTLKAQAEAWQAKVDHTIAKWSGKPLTDPLRARLTTFLQDKHEQRPEDEFLMLLPQVAQILAPWRQKVDISGITFERHEQRLRMALQVTNFADIDAIQTALATCFKVERDNVKEENHRISVVLTVNQKTGGEA